MVSIKVTLKKDNNCNVEHITSCLNIIMIKYTERNGNLNNAIILVPPKVYKIMSQKCSKEEIEEGVGIMSFFHDWVKLVESKHSKDTLIIIDKRFFNIGNNADAARYSFIKGV